MIGRWPAPAARWPTLRGGRWLNEHIAVDSNMVRVFSHLELAGARGLSAGEIGDQMIGYAFLLDRDPMAEHRRN